MSLSINDGKATPVAHVFTQDAQQNGADPALHVNRANANGPAYWETIASTVTLSKSDKQKNVVKAKIHLPKSGTVDGNPAVLGAIDVIVTVLADPKASTTADVTDALALTANYLGNATVKSQMASFAPLLV